MKLLPLAALMLAAPLTAPAFADDHSEAPAHGLSIDSPIELLMAHEGAKAIVLAQLPGLDQHPSYADFKTMSLVSLKPWSSGEITDEIIENIRKGLSELD